MLLFTAPKTSKSAPAVSSGAQVQRRSHNIAKRVFITVAHFTFKHLCTLLNLTIFLEQTHKLSNLICVYLLSIDAERNYNSRLYTELKVHILILLENAKTPGEYISVSC